MNIASRIRNIRAILFFCFFFYPSVNYVQITFTIERLCKISWIKRKSFLFYFLFFGENPQSNLAFKVHDIFAYRLPGTEQLVFRSQSRPETFHIPSYTQTHAIWYVFLCGCLSYLYPITTNTFTTTRTYVIHSHATHTHTRLSFA